MSKNRPVRVGDEMRRILADLIRNEIKDPRIPMLTSVTNVEVSGDLSHATVYVSVMGTGEEQENCLTALVRASGFLRREIGQRMRIRVNPELHFRLDHSIEQGMRMTRLIDEAMGRALPDSPDSKNDEYSDTADEASAVTEQQELE